MIRLNNRVRLGFTQRGDTFFYQGVFCRGSASEPRALLTRGAVESRGQAGNAFYLKRPNREKTESLTKDGREATNNVAHQAIKMSSV